MNIAITQLFWFNYDTLVRAIQTENTERVVFLKPIALAIYSYRTLNQNAHIYAHLSQSSMLHGTSETAISQNPSLSMWNGNWSTSGKLT